MSDLLQAEIAQLIESLVWLGGIAKRGEANLDDDDQRAIQVAILATKEKLEACRVNFERIAKVTPSAQGWFPTYSGVKFYVENPKIENIRIIDIAHSLSMQTRFAGHLRGFYSVAQHSVLVSQNVPKELALCGLLHDAAEAYCQDMLRPIKYLPGMEAYRAVEANLERLIAQKYGLPFPWPPEIKIADNRCLMTERRDLYKRGVGEKFAWEIDVEPFPDKIEPLLPSYAQDLFSVRFYQLTGVIPEKEPLYE
jgi:hypothetical protein